MNCYTTSTSKTSAGSYATLPDNTFKRARLLSQYLKKYGNFTKTQCAAICGVAVAESDGIKPESVNKMEKNGHGAGGVEKYGYGAGIIQWTHTKYKNQILKDGGYSTMPSTLIENLSLEQQAKMLCDSASKTDKIYFDSFRRCHDINNATATFACYVAGIGSVTMNTWKKSHPTVSDATKILKKYGGQKFEQRLDNAKQILRKL